METTLFRLYAPTLSLSNRKHIVKWIGRNPLSIRLMLEQFFYVQSLDLYYLKYCPECITDDISQYGVAYWHRSHCCKFAFACHRHMCKLVPVGIIPSGEECFLLPSYSDATTGKPDRLLVEKEIHDQLSRPVNSLVSPEELKNHLGISNISTAGLLQKKIEQRFTDVDLEQLGIRYRFADGVKKTWVWNTVEAVEKTHIPEILAALFN